MGLPTNFTNKYAGMVTSSTTFSTLFTHSSALKNPDGSAGYGGVLDRLILYNPDSTQHTIDIYRVGSGLSAGTSNLIEHITLGVGAPPYVYEGPLYGSSGDFYQMRLGEPATSQLVSLQSFYHEMS